MGIEEYFAQAVDRLMAGESIDDILVSYPPSVRGELRSLLVVVEAAERMATVTVPAPASLNRVSARLLFAQRAAELRGELAAVSAAAPAAAYRSTGASTSEKPGLRQRLRDWWDIVQPPAPIFRFAPLTLVLIAAYLLTSTIVGAAQGSLPGDQIYALKQWMSNQRLATAPPELVVAELGIIAEEKGEEVSKTATELSAQPDAEAIKTEGTFLYLGEDLDFMYFGNLLVTKGYRTDINDPDTWTPMSGTGELQPGIRVTLHYQIVPSMLGVVEGISFEVQQEAPQPTPTPTPIPTPLPGGDCQRVQSPGWTSYALRPGETLRDLAGRSNVSSEELRSVNCLTDGPVRAGTTIFVPARIAAPPRPLQPVISATPVPTATSLPPTAGPTITPTSSVGSTPTEPAATESPDATATEASGQTPGPENTAGATPTDAAATPTNEATPLATETPAAPESSTPANGTGTPASGTDTPGTSPATPSQSTGTPSASPTAGAETGTPSTEIPPTGTTAPESSTTPAATASPTGAVSATATTAPTSAASPAATAVSSPQATATPTAGTSSSATATATPAATSTSPAVATATPTATQVVPSAATEVSGSTSGGIAATSTPTAAATPTSVPPTATQPPPPPPTATPQPPTATPLPPPPTATPPPPAPTEASTTDSGESP